MIRTSSEQQQKMTEAEKRCKAVDRLGKTIKDLLKKGLDDTYVQGQVNKYEEYVEGIKKGELAAGVEETYLKTIDRFRATIGDLRLAKANNNSHQQALPKEKALEHDGKIGSFFGFWKRAEKSILELNVNKTAKFRALRAAVHVDDANRIALLDTVYEVKAYLQEKYTLEAAVQSLMNAKSKGKCAMSTIQPASAS